MSTICSIDFIRETKESAIVRKNMSWPSSGCETAASMRFESVVTSRRRRRHRLLVAVAANYRSLIGASSGPQEVGSGRTSQRPRGQRRIFRPIPQTRTPEGSAELFNRFHKPAPRIRACADLSFLRPSHPWKPAGPTRQKCPATDRACKSRGPRELRVKARPTRAASSDRFRNPNEANRRRRRRAAALPPSAMPFDSAPP